MVRTFEIKKNGEGYSINEQAGSDPHREQVAHEAASRQDAAQWLRDEGGAPDLVDQVLDDAVRGERVYLEVSGGYKDIQEFPSR